MERAAKSQRIAALRSGLPYVSQSALGAILRLARDDMLPAATSRRCVARARDDAARTRTLLGELHQTVTVAEGIEVEMCNPGAMLLHCSEFTAVQVLLERALANKDPVAPLHVILYADEVTPGNQLAAKTARKTWAFYLTIQEFGQAALANEDCCARSL